jgi:hypothetical protein
MGKDVLGLGLRLSGFDPTGRGSIKHGRKKMGRDKEAYQMGWDEQESKDLFYIKFETFQ